MAVSDDTVRVLKLVNVDEQFHYNEHKAGSKPVILNATDLSEPDYIDKLNALISSDGSGADFMARCQCGELEGNHRMGMTCPVCYTEVAVNNLLDENHLVCRNWLSCPQDLPHGWIAPKIYLNLAEWLSYNKRKNNYLDDILDVTTPIPFELADVVQGKGFHYLAENFDRIMDYFIRVHPVISKKPDTPAMRLCLELNREKVFCHYIPILNSALSPNSGDSSGSSNKKQYTDTTADAIRKAAISLSRLAFSPRKRKNHLYNVETTTFKAFKDIITYVEDATKKYISHKKAIPRTHIFGSRFHCSFRGVVTPITEPHLPDELHIPMKMAVNTLRVQIYGKLLSRGYNINDAVAKLHMALQVVDEEILEIINTMIKESPFPGIPCVWDRPPSIRDGSIMLKFWTKIKTDIDDSTVGITPIDVALPNADKSSQKLFNCIN